MSHSRIPPVKVSIATLGCKLNHYESEAILAQFRSAGYVVADDPETADICIVNTCAVTSAAERKARSLLRSIRQRNRQASLFAVGCMAEHAAGALAEIEGITAIVGNREKEHLLDFLPRLKTAESPPIFVGETRNASEFLPSISIDGMLGRTRAFLKVQDGCSQKCTYCIIPSLRGAGRSLPIAEVVARIERLVDRGFAEIVLTGVALGTYGSDLSSEVDLASLLSAIAAVNGLRRLRLGSIEPWAISERLLRIIAESEMICPHLHIPLQSAEDSVLRRMNRRYTTQDIRRLFDRAFAFRDDWGIGTDIIVGFPGESDDHFNSTCAFLADAPIAYLHVFPYSARPGTPATRLSGQILSEVRQDRVRKLKNIDHGLRNRFRTRHLGSRQTVLFEKRRINGLLAGHTTNYLDVYAVADESCAGELRDVSIIGLHPDGVLGELLN